MRFIHAFLLLSAVMVGIGCGNNSHPAPQIARGPVSSKLSEAGTKNLTNLTVDYYALKNALVATDASNVALTAKQLLVSANMMVDGLRADSVNGAILKPYIDTIIAQSQLITAETDTKCEKQRLAFSPLSNNLFALLKAVDIKNAGVYKEFCPMAFNDKGAYWLSEESEIKNPYFGKKMLECGEVQDSL